MAIFGNNVTPGGGTIYNDWPSGYEYWVYQGNFPSGGGIVTDLYIYAGSHNGSWNGNLCIWFGGTPNYNLIWASGAVFFPVGVQWLHAAVPSIYIAGGTNLAFGWWAGGNTWFAQEGSGTTYRTNASVGGSPAALPASTASAQATGAYVVYTPSGGRVRRSSAWVHGPGYVRRSASWIAAPLSARRTTSWVPGQ